KGHCPEWQAEPVDEAGEVRERKPLLRGVVVVRSAEVRDAREKVGRDARDGEDHRESRVARPVRVGDAWRGRRVGGGVATHWFPPASILARTSGMFVGACWLSCRTRT